MSFLSEDEYQTLLRCDFHTFIHRCFVQLHSQAPFQSNWHIELIADRLEAVRQGRIRRLIINVPPRSLKSIGASVAFPAWLLGHDPSCRVICASYGQELAEKHGRDCRLIMSSPWYRQVFPTRLAADRSATADFQTTLLGGRMSNSVGGALTGRGGDILIIDDPTKPEEALSETQRNAANNWFDHTFYSRLNDKRTGAIVIVMQRLHLDDLVGHVLVKEPWDVISLPAIAAEEENWRYDTLRGAQSHVRHAGEALHPEREPLEVLQRIRESLGGYSFSAQYLQSPVPLGGGLIKRAWLRFDEPGTVPQQFSNILQSWDTANKATELANYSVCTTWGIQGIHIYLLHVYRRRLDYPDLKRAVQEQARLWSPNTILIEDKASGTQLLQELAREGLPQVKGVKPDGDKLMRMHAQTAVIENGFVHFPKKAPWLACYVDEMTSFPHGKFSDQVDSTSQALAWISEAGREPAILTYYRQFTDK
jgi:predicted phage terminase large subunit-like protein